MFSFLKSDDSLEKDLRRWYAEACASFENDPEEHKRAYESAMEQSIDWVVEQAAARVATIDGQQKYDQAMGRNPTVKEAFFLIRGARAIMNYTKRKNIQLVYEGAPALGYTCRIKRP